jgi:ketosteroid isomerase-like protein
MISRKRLATVAAALAVATSVFAQGKAVDPKIEALANAERAFARYAADHNTADAFLRNFAEDSVMFMPYAAPALPALKADKPDDSLLSWGPTYVDVSAAGDLGYSTGPWERKAHRSDADFAAHGYFVSVWKKQADGAWKVLIDVGVRTPDAPRASWDFAAPTRAALKTAEPGAARADLAKADAELSKAVSEQGAAKAYAAWFSDDARLYRMKAFPVVGKQAILAALPQTQAAYAWKPGASGVSASGDLGYTYGVVEAREGETTKYANYVRIWRNEAAGWRVALDLLSPAPPPEAAK